MNINEFKTNINEYEYEGKSPEVVREIVDAINKKESRFKFHR